MVIVITAAVLVVIGAVAALIWWSLADKTFPGAAAKTGQGLRRETARERPGGKVIRLEEAESGPGEG